MHLGVVTSMHPPCDPRTMRYGINILLTCDIIACNYNFRAPYIFKSEIVIPKTINSVNLVGVVVCVPLVVCVHLL